MNRIYPLHVFIKWILLSRLNVIRPDDIDYMITRRGNDDDSTELLLLLKGYDEKHLYDDDDGDDDDDVGKGDDYDCGVMMMIMMIMHGYVVHSVCNLQFIKK